jgi:hypothetical protein
MQLGQWLAPGKRRPRPLEHGYQSLHDRGAGHPLRCAKQDGQVGEKLHRKIVVIVI